LDSFNLLCSGGQVTNLLAGAVGQCALQLEHSTRNFVTNSRLSLLVVDDSLAAKKTVAAGSRGGVVRAMHFD
jgi:hypothetical protein